jgi:hypothetical protein
MREADAPTVPDSQTFRYSIVSACTLAIGGIAVSAAFLGKAIFDHMYLGYYVASVILLMEWLMRRMVFARFEPTNWLVRMADDGVFIKFRSYLNTHLPAQDTTVAFVPFRDIRSAKLVREMRAVRESDNGVKGQQRVLVQLQLADDSTELSRALDAERGAQAPKVKHWYGSTSMRAMHFPVRMASARCLEIEWGATPGASDFIKRMAVHVDTEASDVSKDFTSLSRLTRYEQDAAIRELAETGEIFAAQALARRLFGFDNTQAHQYVGTMVGTRPLIRRPQAGPNDKG